MRLKTKVKGNSVKKGHVEVINTGATANQDVEDFYVYLYDEEDNSQ
jgi:hypothetical protein